MDAILGIDVAPVNDAPTVTDLHWTQSVGNVFTFTGKVNDEAPGGLTVTFGSLLDGHSTVTASDGTFWYSLVLPEEVQGTVTVETEDGEGLSSNLGVYPPI